MTRESGTVAYLFTTFPKTSETFLQREVRAIGECGAVEQEDACHREQDTAWK